MLFTLYLTWSPWHYTGQNYGIAVMFLRRRGVERDAAREALALRGVHPVVPARRRSSSHLEVGTAYSPLAYSSESVTFLPVGITRGVGDVVLPILGAAYLVSLVVSAVLLRRAARWRDLAARRSRSC